MSEDMLVTRHQAPIVIIGTGLAGYTLAREYRKTKHAKPLIIITNDDGRSYSKPMLSTGFTKGKTADQLAMLDAGKMVEQLDATIRTFTKVTAIDTQQRKLILNGEEELAYDQLVLANGAETIKAPIKGNAADELLSVNDLLDYSKLRKQLTDKKKITIIGAGLIGCEFANDLTNGGYTVEVVDPMPQVLPTFLPKTCADAVQKGLESIGITFHLGPYVEAVDKTEHGYQLTLSNKQVLNSDLVISAVGLRPRTELAQAAGIEVNRGIVVNRQLATNKEHVFALGDCAEVDGHVLLYVLPLMAASRALAKTLAGQPTDVVYPAMPITIKTPAFPVVVSPPPATAAGQWSFEESEQGVKGVFMAEDSKQLLGFALTGSFVSEKQILTKQLPAIFS